LGHPVRLYSATASDDHVSDPNISNRTGWRALIGRMLMREIWCPELRFRKKCRTPGGPMSSANLAVRPPDGLSVPHGTDYPSRAGWINTEVCKCVHDPKDSSAHMHRDEHCTSTCNTYTPSTPLNMHTRGLWWTTLTPDARCPASPRRCLQSTFTGVLVWGVTSHNQRSNSFSIICQASSVWLENGYMKILQPNRIGLLLVNQ
jgi:hypothetical protein